MTPLEAILCLDIDGTLIDPHEKVHPNDIRILRDFPKTVQPVLATGRPLHSARAVLQQNGLFQQPSLPLPGVYLNGGTAYLPGEKLCLKHPFSPETRTRLITLADEFPATTFAFFSVSSVHLVNPKPNTRQIAHRHHLNTQESPANSVPKEIIKVMVIEPSQSILWDIYQRGRVLLAEVAYSLDYLLEFNPPGINKAHTLLLLLKRMGLEGLPVFAVGDGGNDLALFGLAKTSFAPDTALPTVLAHADHILPREQNGLLAGILATIKKERN